MPAFLVHPDINPVILQIIGPVSIRWYSLMYVVGFLFVFLFVTYYINKKVIKLKLEDFSDLIFWAILGVVIGARIGYVLFYNLSYYLANPIKIFVVWEGGMSFHGALIGVLIVLWIFSMKKKINPVDIGDIVAIPVPLALGFGRWGNFVNGELWGKPTDAPWGMLFTARPEAGNSGPPLFPLSQPWVQDIVQKTGLPVTPGQTMVNLPRHPSQLYELILEGIILFTIMFLLFKFKKHKSRGFFASVFLIGYGFSRVFVEFFREPDAQLGYLLGGWLTMGIILSAPMVLAGIFGLIYFGLKDQENALWAK